MHQSVRLVAMCGVASLALLSSPAWAGTPVVNVGAAGPLMAPSALPSEFTSATSPTARTVRDPLVAELARSLHYNAAAIFEHVRNHVELTPQFGLLKGARGAVLDGYGTPFDQAQLLVDLLRETDSKTGTNYAPSYIFNSATIPLSDFQKWFGVSDRDAAAKVLADGGFPAVVSGTSVTISHVWVRINYNGELWDFDPSYKTHTSRTPINLQLVDNLSKSTLVSAASGSASGSSVSGLNVANLRSQLDTYRTSIENYLNTPANSYVGVKASDALGVPQIDPQTASGAAPTSFPTPMPTVAQDRPAYLSGRLSTGSGNSIWTGEVPDVFRTYFTAKMTKTVSGTEGTAPGWDNDSINKRFYADEVYGKPIIFPYGYNKSTIGNPYKSIAGTDIKAALATPDNMACDAMSTQTVTLYSLYLSINHPYPYSVTDANKVVHASAYMDRTVSKSLSRIDCSDGYVIVTNDWGDVGGKTIDLMRRAVSGYPYSATLSLDLVTTGPALEGVAKQYSEYLRLGDATLGSVHQLHDLIGIHQLDLIGQRTSYSSGGSTDTSASMLSMDFEAGVSINPKSGTSSAQRQGEAAVAVGGLGLVESAGVRDENDAPRDATALTLLTSLASSSTPYYSISGANGLTGLSLPTYDTEAKAGIQAYLNANYTVLLPQNGQLAQKSYTGTSTGGVTYSTSLLEDMNTQATWSRSVIYVIDPVSGSGSYAVWDPRRHSFTKGGVDVSLPSTVAKNPEAPKASSANLGFKDLTVDPKSGDATYSPATDIVDGPGDFPQSLPFKRRYDPSDLSDYGLGVGWKHNWVQNVTLINDGDTAFGQSGAFGAASAMVGMRAIAALATPTADGSPQPTDARTLLMEAVVHQWMADQTINNVAQVTAGLDGEDKFYRKSGSTSAYVAANPDGGALTQTNEPVDSIINRRLYAWGNDQDQSVKFTYQAPGVGTRVYHYVTFTLGDMTQARNASMGTNKSLYLDQWTFPDGNIVTATYKYDVGTTAMMEPLSATNSFGASLSMGLLQGQTVNYDCEPDDHDGDRAGSFTVTAKDGSKVVFNLSLEARYNVADCPGDSLKSNETHFRVKLDSVTDQVSSKWKYSYRNPSSTGYTVTFPASDTPSLYGLGAAPDVGRLVTITKPSDTDAAQIVLGNNGDAQTITDALGNQYIYYSSTYRGENVDPLGASSTTYFDQYGRAVQAIDALGNVTQTSYDLRDRVAKATQAEGNAVEYTYDLRSNPKTKTLDGKDCAGQATCASQLITAYTFGSVTDGPNVLVCSSMATCNHPVRIQNARQYVTTYGWDSSTGNLTSVTSGLNSGGTCALPSGVCPQTTYSYASVNNLNLLSTSSQVVASGQNLVTKVNWGTNNGRSVLSSSILDYGTSAGKLNITTAFDYDPIGNVTKVDGPLTADETYFQWNADRTLKATIGADPDGASAQPDGTASLPRLESRFLYTANGQLDHADVGTTTDSTGGSFTLLQQTAYLYDLAGGMLRKKVWNGNTGTPETYAVTEYTNNAAGRLQCTATRMNFAVLTDTPTSACAKSVQGSYGKDRITRTYYDLDGRPTDIYRGYATTDSIRYASYVYNPNGTVRDTSDGDDSKTRRIYDSYDRLTRINYPDAGVADHVDATNYESYGLDENGNHISLRKRDGSLITYDYDALDRMMAKHVPVVKTKYAYDIRYDYDAAGHQCHARTTTDANLDCATSAGPAGLDFGYDAVGRLTSEATNGKKLTYGVDLAGRRTKIAWPTVGAASSLALTIDYNYDNLGRTTKIYEDGVSSGPGVLARFSYDTHGRRSTFGRAGTIAPNATTPWTSYGYDGGDRLTGMTNSLADGANGLDSSNNLTLSFVRNPAAQIVSRTGSDAYDWTNFQIGTKAPAFDHLNRDQGIVGTLAACGNSSGYDCNGNLTNDGARTFSYDLENRMRSGATGATSVAFDYDPNGRLQQIASTTGTVTTTTSFLYSGSDLVAEYDGSGQLLNRYVHGPGDDDPIVQYAFAPSQTIPRRRMLFSDNQGSIVATTADNDSGVSTTYAYGPNGEPQRWTGSRFMYTGQVAIPELQLYYYKARIYDPYSGRFLQTDPIGDRDDSNLYAYVGNDPVDRADPTGLYNCTNQKVCAAAEKIRNGFIRAQKHFKVGTTGYNKLQQSLDALGTLNDGNDIDVSQTRPGDGSLGRGGVDPYTKRGILQLNVALISQYSNPALLLGELTATGAHELKHIADNKKNGGYPRTRSDEFWNEVRGVRAETPVWEGLDVDDSSWKTWTKQGGLNMRQVDKEAEASTDLWCTASTCPK